MNILTVLLYPAETANEEGVHPWRAQGLEKGIVVQGIGPLRCKREFLIEVEKQLTVGSGRLDHIQPAPRNYFEAAVRYTRQGPLLPLWREDSLYERFYVRFLEMDF